MKPDEERRNNWTGYWAVLGSGVERGFRIVEGVSRSLSTGAKTVRASLMRLREDGARPNFGPTSL